MWSRRCSGEYGDDDANCCDPMSWCEFFPYLYIQLLCATFFLPILFRKRRDYKVDNLRKNIRLNGVAIPAAALGKHLKYKTYRRGVQKIHYYTLVEFTNVQGDTVLKDLEVSPELFEKITVPYSVSVFHLPEYPKSGIVDDTHFENRPDLLRTLALDCILCLSFGIDLAMACWYVQTFESISQAIPRLTLIIFFQFIVAGCVWYFVLLREYPKKEDALLRDEAKESDLVTNTALADGPNSATASQSLLGMAR